MHANFSTNYMREIGGKDYFENLMEAFETRRLEHIAVYGPDNHLRLTGLHETAADRQILLRRGRSRRFNSHSAFVRGEPITRLSRRPPSQLAGRPLSDRFAHSENHCIGVPRRN